MKQKLQDAALAAETATQPLSCRPLSCRPLSCRKAPLVPPSSHARSEPPLAGRWAGAPPAVGTAKSDRWTKGAGAISCPSKGVVYSQPCGVITHAVKQSAPARLLGTAPRLAQDMHRPDLPRLALEVFVCLVLGVLQLPDEELLHLVLNQVAAIGGRTQFIGEGYGGEPGDDAWQRCC